MRDCEQYYDSKKFLKEDYPHFYFSLCNFIKTLSGTWFFSECHNPDCDGSRFEITLHDACGNFRQITATKSGATYIFKQNQ